MIVSYLSAEKRNLASQMVVKMRRWWLVVAIAIRAVSRFNLTGAKVTEGKVRGTRGKFAVDSKAKKKTTKSVGF